MSIRARRIKTIEWNKSPSFNITKEYDILQFIETNGDTGGLSDTGTGIIEIEIESMEKLIKRKSIDKQTKKNIQQDIKQTKKNGDTYIMYMCY